MNFYNQSEKLSNEIVMGFLHEKYYNYKLKMFSIYDIWAKRINAEEQYEGEIDMNIYASMVEEDDTINFWEYYEKRAFNNIIVDIKSNFMCQYLNFVINKDYESGIVDIYNETYINYTYIQQYSLFEYWCNTMEIRQLLKMGEDSSLCLK
jgi:hypothetical protein